MKEVIVTKMANHFTIQLPFEYNEGTFISTITLYGQGLITDRDETRKVVKPIVDRIEAHLIKQGKPATVQDFDGFSNGCRYRGDNGTMCAVGCLIDDEHYSDKLEGQSALDSDVKFAVQNSIGVEITSSMVDALYAVQQIHDNTAYLANPEDFTPAIQQGFAILNEILFTDKYL